MTLDICQGSLAFQKYGRYVWSYSWGCSSIALFGRLGGISTKAAAVGAALSVPNEYRSEEDDKRIPACIADIEGDTVGDIAGVGAVLLGSFAEAMCAALVLIASSDALGNSWKAQRYPVLIFSLSLLEVR